MRALETVAPGDRLRAAASSRTRLAPLAPVALALLTWRVWPVNTVDPTTGLDSSWKIGLHLAAAHDLVFGRDVIFTYGPLGFLTQPLAVTPLTGALSLAFSLAVWVALAFAVLAAARRAFPPLAAFLLAYVVLCLPIQIADALVLLVFLGTIAVLESDTPLFSRWLVPAAGVFAAAVLLVKLNDGILALVLLSLAAWRLRPRRLAAEGVLWGSFAVAVVLLWLLTGNPVAALPHWLRSSWDVVGGYAETMAAEAPGRWPQYVWAGASIVAAAVLLALHLERRRLACWAAAVVFAAAFAKEGFDRHDGHDVIFFSALAVGVLAYRWSRPRTRALAAAVALAAASAVVATPEIGLRDLVRPVSSASTALADARLVVDSARLRGEIDASRDEIRAQAGVSPSLLRLLRGHSTAVVPEEISVAWAYELTWRPEPTLQDYAAYDTYLDTANARAIDRHGADRLLQAVRWPGVDGTHPLLEAPATSYARLCRYRALRTAGRWTVLGRTADRCGASVPLGARTGRAGEPLAVPAPPHPQDAVVARIELRTPLPTRLAHALFKPVHLPKIVLGSTTYRFVAASAGGPLVLRLPRASGLPAFLGGSVDYRQLTLLDVPSPFSVSFSAVPIAGAGTPERAAHVDGRLDEAGVVIDGRRVPIRPGTPGQVDGWFDWGATGGVSCAVPGRRLAVFVGRTLVAVARSSAASDDVRVAFPLVRGVPVRVFAVGRGAATELGYPAGYPWR